MNETQSGNKAGIFIMAAIILLIFGSVGAIFFISDYKYKVGCTEYAEGIVIKNESYYKRSKHSYRPVVQFEVKGKIYIVKSNLYKNPKSFKEGDKVTLHYNPDNLANIWIDGHNSNSTIIFGIVLILIGIVLSILFVRYTYFK